MQPHPRCSACAGAVTTCGSATIGAMCRIVVASGNRPGVTGATPGEPLEARILAPAPHLAIVDVRKLAYGLGLTAVWPARSSP